MTTFHSLSCANCGAPLAGPAPPGTAVTCQHCGTSFRSPAALTPQPDMGDLILGADFRDADLPGWRIVDPKQVEFKVGPPPEILADYQKSNVIHPVIRTPGPFDDFDVGVTLRFVKGAENHVSAGLELRYSERGDYVFRIRPDGAFSVGWHDGLDWGGELVKWTTHPDLRTGLDAANRMRVILHGDRIRVYLNGILATSLRDDRYHAGLIRLVVAPSKRSTVVVGFSDLQLREVLAR